MYQLSFNSFHSLLSKSISVSLVADPINSVILTLTASISRFPSLRLCDKVLKSKFSWDYSPPVCLASLENLSKLSVLWLPPYHGFYNTNALLGFFANTCTSHRVLRKVWYQVPQISHKKPLSACNNWWTFSTLFLTIQRYSCSYITNQH